MDIFLLISNFFLSDLGLIITFCVLGALFLVSLIFSLLGLVDTRKKIIFLIAGASISIFYLAFYLCVGRGEYICLIALGVTSILACPIFLVGEKNALEDRELIRKIDEQINSEPITESVPFQPKRIIVEQKPYEKKKEEREVDFSHVKNILARLDYFSLSNADKRAVGELENFLDLAENGDNSKEVKLKVNEGLSSLLKIMSKYGV